MGFDIFNNHGHYNKFIVLNGMRINNTPAVSSYILAEQLKKLVSQASKTMLEKAAKELYGNIGYRSSEIVKEYLNVRIESCGTMEVKRALKTHCDTGLYACIMYLVKL